MRDTLRTALGKDLDHDGFQQTMWNHVLDTLPRSEQPVLVVLAGGSGVGKTTMVKTLKRIKSLDETTIELTPDIIKKFAPRLNKGSLTRHPEKSPENLELYYKIRDRMVLDCLRRGVSVVLDDHCDDLNRQQTLMQEIHNVNPHIETALLGLFLAPQEQEKRLAGKGVALKTGKDYEFAMQNVKNFSNNFSELAKLFASSILIENTDGKNVAAKYQYENGELKKFEESDRYTDFAVYSDSLAPPQPIRPIKWSGTNSLEDRLDPRLSEVSWQKTAEDILREARLKNNASRS